MSGDFVKSLVGGALIGASFALPGLGQLAALYIGSTLLRQAIAPKMDPKQKGVLRNDASTQAAVPVIYGETLVGVRPVDFRTSAAENRDLYVVGVLCHGSRDNGDISDIREMYADERLVFDAAGVIQSAFQKTMHMPTEPPVLVNMVSLSKHKGSTSQVVDTLMNTIHATAWPTTSKGLGIAYVVVVMRYDKDIFPTGIPNITLKVRGNRVYDPRDLTWKYSDNPALCIRDYLRSTVYGCAVEEAELHEQSFIDAANFCDETVTWPGGSQKRFTCNGWLDVGDSCPTNVQKLLSSCRGELVYTSGQFHLVIRAAAVVTGFKLTRDNIIGNWSIKLPGTDEMPNTIEATYVDPTRRYQAQSVQFPDIGASNPYLTADNSFKSVGAIDLPFTLNPYMARQIAMVALKERRFSEMVTVTVKEAALTQRVGDLIEVTHDTPGWTDKPAWLVSMAPAQEGTIQIGLLTYDPNAYSYDEQDMEESLPDTDLPDPFIVDPPTGLVATSGTNVSMIRFSWLAPDHPFLDRYEVEGRRIDDPDFKQFPPADKSTPVSYVGPVRHAEQWILRVRAVSTLGVRSEWVSETHTVNIVLSLEALVTAVAEPSAIFYEVLFGASDTWKIEVFSIQNAGSGGTIPPESGEYFVTTLMRDTVESIRIATTGGQWRRTRFIPYSEDGVRGPEVVLDTQATTSGGGPSAAPSALAKTGDTGSTISISWTNGDATAETRVYVNGIPKTVAAGLTAHTFRAELGQSYQVAVDHFKNGQASALHGPVTMSITSFTLNPPTDYYTMMIGCGSGDAFMGHYWTLGANGIDVATEMQIASLSDFSDAVTWLITSVGYTYAPDDQHSTGTYWFRIRHVAGGATPSAWTAGIQGTYGCGEIE